MPVLENNTSAVSNNLVVKPQKKLPKDHPLVNPRSHKKLLDWVRAKLASDYTARNNRCTRFASIDRSVSGWISKYSDSDADRKALQDATGEPAVVKQNLSLIQVHLDDMASYYLDIFAPTRGIYYALGPKEKLKNANKMAALLSAHARKTQRIMQLNRFFINSMKYNLGGLHTYWKQEYGVLISNDIDGQAVVEPDQLVWEGNAVDSVDMYNFFFDGSTDIVDLHHKGEWCATAELMSHFDLYKKNAQGLYSNFGDIFDQTANHTYFYYKSPPSVAGMNSEGIQDESNWMQLWLGDGTKKDTGTLIEIVKVHAFLNPRLFGLGTKDEYRQYKIVLAGGTQIIAVTEMHNIHGLLPYNFARPLDDQMKGNQKAVSEILSPLQDFASFCMNIHAEGVRSQIYGTRIFNSAFIDLDKVPKGEVNANIPTKPGAKAVPLNQIAMKLDSTVDTAQLINSMNVAFDMANSMFPATQMPSQVAGIDRAIDSQVAAAVQGANKRLKKYGRVLVDQCLEPSKVMQIKNSQQFFRDSTLQGPNGQQTSITAAELRDEDVTTQIGHGLMTLDRERMVKDLRDIFFATVQSQAATQQLDIVAMLGEMLELMDYHLDVESFRQQQQPQQPNQQGGQPNVPTGGTQPAGPNPQAAINPGAPSG